MKSLLILLLTILFFDLSGQDLSISAGFEKTVVGTELHLSSGYVTKKNWSLGAFHQMKIANTVMADLNNNAKSGMGWYGLYINAPLANTKKINVFFQLRAGISENRFIVVVPSIETSINLSKVISVSVGSSFRYSYPGFSVKTNIRLFKSHKQ